MPTFSFELHIGTYTTYVKLCRAKMLDNKSLKNFYTRVYVYLIFHAFKQSIENIRICRYIQVHFLIITHFSLHLAICSLLSYPMNNS